MRCNAVHVTFNVAVVARQTLVVIWTEARLAGLVARPTGVDYLCFVGDTCTVPVADVRGEVLALGAVVGPNVVLQGVHLRAVHHQCPKLEGT